MLSLSSLSSFLPSLLANNVINDGDGDDDSVDAEDRADHPFSPTLVVVVFLLVHSELVGCDTNASLSEQRSRSSDITKNKHMGTEIIDGRIVVVAFIQIVDPIVMVAGKEHQRSKRASVFTRSKVREERRHSGRHGFFFWYPSRHSTKRFPGFLEDFGFACVEV